MTEPTPYWTREDGAAPVTRPQLPSSCDALVVGAGYTGLAAAHELARGGRRTVVLDAGGAGAGCSGRNGGQVAYSIKPTRAALGARFGMAVADGICADGQQAVAHLQALARDEGLDMDWRPRGLFLGAHTRRAYEVMAREAGTQPWGFAQPVEVLPRARVREEIATDYYHGGCVFPQDASVNPARLLAALERRARDAGATIVTHCEAKAIGRSDGYFEVETGLGRVRTRQVLVATNGYTGRLVPWLRRRVIPIGSYQIATEPLGTTRVQELMRHGRNYCDSRRIVVYYRPSPDGERILYGGRAALSETDPLACAPRLRSMLVGIFPQLADVRISHAWAGWIGYTFDTLPHLGCHDGIHYCMGYCGQGVPMAPYLGMRVGQQMLGLRAGATAFDGLPFPTRPYYFGTPWFLAASVFFYRQLDRLGI